MQIFPGREKKKSRVENFNDTFSRTRLNVATAEDKLYGREQFLCFRSTFMRCESTGGAPSFVKFPTTREYYLHPTRGRGERGRDRNASAASSSTAS